MCWTKEYVRVDKTTKVEKNIPERRTIIYKVQAKAPNSMEVGETEMMGLKILKSQRD